MNSPINEDIQQILKSIEKLLESKDFIIIAIDGKSGSGKTTLANALSSLCDSNLFHMDDFFLRPELKTEERMKEIGGNVDYVRFKEEVIDGIYSREKFKYQIYDCKEMALTDYISVEPKRINIIEGSYSMHPTLIENYDYKIFLNLDYDTQKERILKRNDPSAYKRFIDEWIPKENIYFNEMKIKEKCDIVIYPK
ncbi:MAG: AAA family ATPase [Tissierellaceae bacterium]|nr:AAA family ATPase [Tissierellaceae bacterium]